MVCCKIRPDEGRTTVCHITLAAAILALSGCSAVGTSSSTPIGNPAGTSTLGAQRIPPAFKHCAASPSGSGILKDGDFSKAHDPGNWQTFYKGQSLAPGWTVTKRSSDLYGSQVNHFPNGECSVDLDGFHPGGVKSASFPTTPNVVYTVAFLFSGNDGGPPTIKTMQLDAAGQFETLQWDTSKNGGPEKGDYAVETWNFTANATRARLTFTSLDVNDGHVVGWGPVIAAVSVTQNQ